MTPQPSPSLVVLDDDEDLLDSLVVLFEDLGARCAGVKSVPELTSLGDAALGCRLAILDVNLGPEALTGLDAYAWLRAHDFAGRVVFLTGHARSHPLVEAVRKLGALVLEKPVAAAELEALLEDAST
jgi:FixJ family two-component response regulator